MELILMLVAVVFQSGLYLAAPLFIAFLAFKVGQEVGRRAGIPSLQWVLPVTVIGVPSMWTVAGYASFTTQCRNLPEPSFESFPKSRPNGFFLDEEGIAQAPFNRGSLIYDRLPFEFYEQSYFTGNAYSPKAVEHFRRTYSNRKSENIPGPSSEYAVVFSPPQQVTSWWNPPIYVSEIVVMERKSKNVMARAYDLVFGGGIVGQYLHIPKMNYDYRYLSCGFASKEIGVWRTRHGNDPRYSQYVLADANFVSTALSPVGNSDSTASK